MAIDKVKWYCLKYLGNIGKELYSKKLYSKKLYPVNTDLSIDVEMVSFSSKGDLPEQVLSIFSFVKHVGNPKKWIVYSDGTHGKLEIELLNYYFPFVEVNYINFKDKCISLDNSLLEIKDQLIDYSSKYPLGKKLLYYLSHKVNGTTVFLDSDIIFYQGSRSFFCNAKTLQGNYFMEDNAKNYDARMENILHNNANSGFIIVNKTFKNFKNAVDFLKRVNFKYEYFTEQTFLHILFHDNSFECLDKDHFILSTKDQFSMRSWKFGNATVLRHYTNPVRFKMWVNTFGSQKNI